MLPIFSLPSEAFNSHTQPLPKRAAAAAPKAALNFSKSPKVDLIASPRLPDGSPPALGPMTFQNSVWL